jgi:Icc-related predicted phosphoesterase
MLPPAYHGFQGPTAWFTPFTAKLTEKKPQTYKTLSTKQQPHTHHHLQDTQQDLLCEEIDQGFAGGFGRRTLEPWGEKAIKKFVQESLDEALKLESALARLRTHHRIVLLHYAPIEATVAGEPPEIYAFLGSSRLEEPLNRYEVTAVFHGHAHRGTLEGKTQTGVPVYNVALPLFRRSAPDQPPFRVIDVSLKRTNGK